VNIPFPNRKRNYALDKALLKRGITGTFHHISKKHLSRYCNEFSFRWDNRQVTDGERTENAIKGIIGQSLLLKELVG
jgi:hypothetical protein